MDYGLFYILGVLLSLMLPFDFTDKFYFTFALEVPFLWIPVEALLLSTWGTTTGQAVFGVVVRDENENKLSFLQALKRAAFFGKRPGHIECKPITRWRYIVAIVVALTCGSSLFLGKDLSDAAVHFEKQMVGEWIQYASDEGNFTVQFPKKPKEETHSFEIPNSTQSLELSEVKAKSDAVFSVSYVELPKKWRIFSAGTLLKAAMEVVHGHMPGTDLVDTKRIKHKNYPALDFQMKEGESFIEGRLILVGSTLYKLTVTYPPEALHEQHEAFLNSFDLKQ
jgi:hypothetical protein